MSTLTENYNLIKPASSDNVNIEDINNNMDTIDEALNNKSENTHGHQLADSNIAGILPVSKGGTGATSSTEALSNLGAAHEGHLHALSGMGLTGTLPVSKGGTGATTKEQARTNLEAAATVHVHALTDAGIVGTLPVSKGGTGATSASSALSNLGAASASHTHSLSSSTITGTLPISKGGTGATSATDALRKLGIKSGEVSVTVPKGEVRGSEVITFDEAYPNTDYIIVVSVYSGIAGGNEGRTATFTAKTATGFELRLGMNNASTTQANSAACSWITMPFTDE